MNYDFDQVVKSGAWSPGPGCHGGCGVKICLKDGKVVNVEGDEDHPWSQGRVCPKLLAMTQYMYHPDRILYPMKRLGERGSGKFERITWDEALDTVERKFGEIKKAYGPESVIFCQGTGRDIGGPISFLAFSYGSPNWVQLGLAGHSCYTPRLGAMMATFGDYAVLDASQFLEKRYEDPQYRVPEVIIIWGQNPSSGCPDGFFGHWVVDCMKKGTKIIVVDPRWTYFSSRAEKFLQIRPGTDAALAMAMINVIISEELYDKDFVEKWTVGFEELKAKAAEYTPQKVSEITWIPAEDIAAAARMYAKAKPAGIQWGVPVDMNPEGSTVAQAITHLWCITGNLDIPGGQVIARPSHNVTTYPFSTQEMNSLYGEEFVRALNQKRIGAAEHKMLRGFRGWAQPDDTVLQMITGSPYPIKAAWVQTTNVVGGQAANPKLHLDAFNKLDFVVVADLFHNPTTLAAADIILPVATFIEKQSFRSWWAPLQLIVPAAQVGECRSDWEINLELAQRFNPELKSRYRTVTDLINGRLESAETTWDELKAKGGWAMPPDNSPSKPYKRYERGLLREDGEPGFRTKSGKCELYSSDFESWDMAPLPYFSEAPESEARTPEKLKKYPFILVSGRRSPLFFHSEHRMIPWLRAADPDPIIEINTDVAKNLGIENGEWVQIENDYARIRRKAKVNGTIHPKTVSVPHGWWLPEHPETLFDTWEINVNNLIPIKHPAAKGGYGGGEYKTTLVSVSKLTGEPLGPKPRSGLDR